MILCRCGELRRRQHEVTDACLSPTDQAFVREVAAELDRLDLGPWWHQSAGVTGGSTPIPPDATGSNVPSESAS